MADFLPNLWSSVFTPGPTPTLLVATNATFAALQFLLLALLAATYSVHFAILSVLCAGMWYSINWFASELAAAQTLEKEEEKEAERSRKKRRPDSTRKEDRMAVEDSADDEGEDTEIDEGRGLRETVTSVDTEPRGRQNTGRSTATGAESQLEVRARKMEELDRSGEISTDSEWEKVSQHGDSLR